MDNQAKRTTSTRIAALLVIAGAAIFACLGGSASASEVHVYSSSIGTAKNELSLTSESGVAVSEQTGEVYVADTEHSRVVKFSALGVAEGSLATVSTPTFVAVDNSTGPSSGDVYVVGEGDTTITKLTPAGAPVSGWGTEEGGERKGRLTGLTEILGIAVDTEGHLWVFNREGSSQATVREFDQALAGSEAEHHEALDSFSVYQGGEPKEENETPVFYGFGARGIAVDSNHLLYLNEGSSGYYARLNAQGEAVPGVNNRARVTLSTNGIATEAPTDDVYFGHVEGLEGNQIGLYRDTSEGTVVEHFGGRYEGLQEKAPALDGLKDISGTAIDSGTGDLYVVDPTPKTSHVAVYALEEVEPPSATLEAPTDVTQHSAKLIGHIDPNAAAGSSRAHEVAWRVVCTPTCPGHAENTYIEADENEHLVEVTLEGLPAGTEYSVKLQAENRGGLSETVKTFKTVPAEPSVIAEDASEIYHGEATLNATINPSGAATTYHFEYMTKEAFEAEGFEGARTERTPDSELPEKAEPHTVSEPISGLESSTAYVYRVVAENSVGPAIGSPVEFRSQTGFNPLETDCPNQALRTEAGARLPDCRAYELVSPPEKDGSVVEPFEAGLQAAVDGSAVTWYTGQTATGVPAAGGAHQDAAFYLSTRVGEGWTSQRLLAPESLGVSSDLVGLTADEEYGLIETSGRGRTGSALYLLEPDQKLTTVVPPQAGLPLANQRAFSFDGASTDDSLFFFESNLKLPTKTSPAIGKDNLYVWDRETDELSLAGVLPGANGAAPAGGSFGGAYSWWGGDEAAGTNFGGADQGMYVEAIHAISETGDRVYFTAGEAGQIYLRSGLTGSKPTTVRVSVANAGERPAAFQEATPNGEMAYFLSSGELTGNANTGPSGEGADLYRYDAGAKAAEALVDVTPLSGGAGAQVQGLLGISADGKSGFLVAKGVLANGGIAGEDNIYRFEELSSGFAYRFVATLAANAIEEKDARDWSPSSTNPKTARVSENGGTLLFMSKSVNGSPEGTCAYGRCAQVYRFSIGGEGLACLSCNPTGEGPPKFGAELSPEFSPFFAPINKPRYGTAKAAASTIYGNLPRNLSPSGTRVFFQSSEPLLPEDVNGIGAQADCTNQHRCVDVYEWEAVGTGSCRTPNQAGGCLYLISTGESGQSSFFLDASGGGEGEEGGESVFILTSSRLVPADEDELSDVYDARVDGGLAAQHQPATVPCGSSGACKGAGSGSPAATSPATSSFQGPGNPKQTQCKKGLIHKHGKCVKKQKRQQKKKHPKRKHHKKKGRATGKKRQGGAK